MKNRKASIRDKIKYKNEWRRNFKYLIYFHWLVGILTIVLASLVASKPEVFGFPQSFYQLIAWIVAACSVVLTVLKPADMAARFHQAWVILDEEIALYLEKPSPNKAAVLRAWKRGEAIIHNYDPGRFHKPKRHDSD